jgi:hypothetical protein
VARERWWWRRCFVMISARFCFSTCYVNTLTHKQHQSKPNDWLASCLARALYAVPSRRPHTSGPSSLRRIVVVVVVVVAKLAKKKKQALAATRLLVRRLAECGWAIRLVILQRSTRGDTRSLTNRPATNKSYQLVVVAFTPIAHATPYSTSTTTATSERTIVMAPRWRPLCYVDR